jgi:hypothetical protein
VTVGLLLLAPDVAAKPKASNRNAEQHREPIPVHHKVIKSHERRVSLDITYPVFDHPSAGARAALLTTIEKEMEPYATAEAADDEALFVDLGCEVASATTALVSLLCHSMFDRSKIADREQGIGGAPAEATLASYLFLIDGARVRKGTLADVLKSPERARPELIKKLQAALAEPCPGLRLLATASLDTFPVDDKGVRFYFQMAAFGDDANAICGREVQLAVDDLRNLLKRNGAFARL